MRHAGCTVALMIAVLGGGSAQAQTYYARSVVSGIVKPAAPVPTAPVGAWRYVIERTYDCRGKGGWLDVQYLSACVVGGRIGSDVSCTGARPAPLTDGAVADPVAAGCPVITERNLI